MFRYLALFLFLVLAACGRKNDLDGDGIPNADDCWPTVNGGGSRNCDGHDTDVNPDDTDPPDPNSPDEDGDGFTVAEGDCDDLDTYGDPADSVSACSAPDGYVTDNTDCDDTDATEFPGAIWWRDRDADTYGDSSSTRALCTKPAGYVSSSFGDDCDDYDTAINPGASDTTVNGTDEDCDGTDGS